MQQVKKPATMPTIPAAKEKAMRTLFPGNLFVGRADTGV